MRRFGLLFLLATLSSAKGISLSGNVGAFTPASKWDSRLSWQLHALWRMDQMVALGLGGGYESYPKKTAASSTGKLVVRLPLGSQLLPVLEGEAGMAFRPSLPESFFLWRLGGGLDLKLGDRSSLLAGMGVQTLGRIYGRMGLLLEF